PYPPLKKENKAEMTARSEELGFVISSLALCAFTAWPLSPSNFAEMLDAVEGLKLTPDSLRQIGERIWYLQRSFNVLCGLTAEDDTLPRRVLEPHPEGRISGLDNVVYGITKQQLPSNPSVRKIMLRLYDRILPNQAKLIKNMGRLMFFKKLRAKDAAAKGSPDLDFMKREYYALRELDERGAPSKTKLEELGLSKAAKKVFSS
ncbi:MAG: aldehyde ferredoxin oxidoreductase C-terminal domain-containing protein, partial [bacterium]